MNKNDGMNYAPVGKPQPVVREGEFVFAAAALDHGGACKCEAFRRLRWWHRKPINPPGQHPTAAQPSRQARA